MPDIDNLKGKLIIGIDLGTTKSGVAAWDEKLGQVRLLRNEEGEDLIPSVVAWDRAAQKWLVGSPAKKMLGKSPGDVVYSIKRVIGRWFDDSAVRRAQAELTYMLLSGGEQDQLNDVMVDFGSAADAPSPQPAPTISAKVLAKLRQTAAYDLGLPLEEVKYAVITVPAYFNVLQREATILAGERAGLTVVGILNEPTAAALAYNASGTLLQSEERRLLVYDLGGGTFDISLLEGTRDEDGYMIFTRLVDGNTGLGGDDIDTSLAKWLAKQIEQRHGTRPVSQIARSRLRLEAERAKIELSDQESTTIRLPAFELANGPVDVEIPLTRSQLEKCAAEVLEDTRMITKDAVEKVAGLRWDQIDEIILVGGQTLTPAIQRNVEALTGHKPRVNDRPQQVVALGAGEYARILTLGEEKFEENALINVIALPLGIRLDDDKFEQLIKANTTLPCENEPPYPATTTEDYQPLINVEILQGPKDATLAKQCVVLGNLEMQVPPAPKRTLKFEVTLKVDSDGTMKVVVTDTRRHHTKTLDITQKKTTVWRDQPATT